MVQVTKTKPLVGSARLTGLKSTLVARLVVEESVRRIESHRRAALRKDRLENASVIDAVTAADRRIADVAKQRDSEAVLKLRTPGETNARLQVVLVVLEAVVDAIRGFFRR